MRGNKDGLKVFRKQITIYKWVCGGMYDNMQKDSKNKENLQIVIDTQK